MGHAAVPRRDAGRDCRPPFTTPSPGACLRHRLHDANDG